MEINHAAPPLLAKERLSDSEGSRHIGLLSSVLANIPVVAVSILMVKGYLVVVEAVPEAALGAHFTDWPAATIPVFVAIAMMFGATLGGNAALIGTAANTVSVGICAHHGKPVTFIRWLRYGFPLTACQLAARPLLLHALIMRMGKTVTPSSDLTLERRYWNHAGSLSALRG